MAEESPAFRPGSGRAGGADADLAVAQGNGAAVLTLDDELAAAVNEQGFGGVGLAVGADRDPVTGHEAEGTVFVEAWKVRAEGQKLPRNGPSQCGAANGGGAARIQAACGRNREELLGPRSDFSKPRQGATEKSANATRKTLHSTASSPVGLLLVRGS